MRVAWAHSQDRSSLEDLEHGRTDSSGRKIGILVATTVLEAGVNILECCSLIQVNPRSLFSVVQFACRGEWWWWWWWSRPTAFTRICLFVCN